MPPLDAKLIHDIVQLHTEVAGDLGVGRVSEKASLELGVRPLDGSRLGSNRARDPVERSELVNDRATDPADCVRLELGRPLGIEFLDRINETEDPVRNEVGLIHAGREPHAHPAGDILDQRRVMQDQTLPESCVSGRLVAPPEIGHRAIRRSVGRLPGLVGYRRVLSERHRRTGRLLAC